MTQNTDMSGMVDVSPPADPDEMLTVRQVAKLLRRNERYVRNELVKPATPESIQLGKHIESVRYGRGPKAHYSIKRRWVDDFIERRRAARGNAPAQANAAA